MIDLHLKKLFAEKVIEKFEKTRKKGMNESRDKLTMARLQKLKKDGLTICVLPIHSKGKAAANCPNCKEEVKLTIDVSDALVEVDQKLFAFLGEQFLTEIHCQYERREKKDVPLPPKMLDVFKLTASRHIFKRLELLEGARELTFDLVFKPLKGRHEDYMSSEVIFRGYSYDADSGKLANIVTKKNYKLDER